jgi:hypothetical protein
MAQLMRMPERNQAEGITEQESYSYVTTYSVSDTYRRGEPAK